jgi:hypothetical protein
MTDTILFKELNKTLKEGDLFWIYIDEWIACIVRLGSAQTKSGVYRKNKYIQFIKNECTYHTACLNKFKTIKIQKPEGL